MFQLHKMRGQGLVEFALILPALLVILFSIIEGAFLFQAYLAIQHAAREAARYAVTYQPPLGYTQEQSERLLKGEDPGNPPSHLRNETPEHWLLRRTKLIQERAYDQSMGIRVLYPALGFIQDHSSVDSTYIADPAWNLRNQAGFFGVEVWGFPAVDESAIVDHPSIQGLPVKVHVTYRWEPLDPIIKVIVPNGIPLQGEAIMVNEGLQVGVSAVAQPTFPPTPTLPPQTGVPTAKPTSTATPTDTPEVTDTPEPTPTPEGPYLLLVPERDQWLLEEMVENPPQVELYNHPDGTYRLYWNDNCADSKPDVYLDRSVSTSGGYGESDLPSGFTYLSADCGVPLPQGEVFSATLKTKEQEGGEWVDVASATVSIYVPFARPDLIVRDVQFVPAEAVTQGGEFLLGVLVENVGEVDFVGTFDVDIYINPSHEPVLKGLPGVGTAGGSSPKQWWTGTVPKDGGPQVVSYVVNVPPVGDHSIWAQVDTSDLVDETDDENNIWGPQELSYPCSVQCDDFDGLSDTSSPSSKWQTLTPIGAEPCSDCQGTAYIIDEALVIQGTGADIWQRSEGRFYFLNQGTYEGDFDMRVQVLEYPNRRWAKAGLMVRESIAVGSRYVAIAVSLDDEGNIIYHGFARMSEGQDEPAPSNTALISSDLFDGNESNGEGVWLRIVREGNTFTLYTSLDGETWSEEGFMTFNFYDDFAGLAYPGIFMAPY
jgi:hypothetical protein